MELEITIIDTATVSENELIELIKTNYEVSRKQKMEISKLEKLVTNTKKEKIPIIEDSTVLRVEEKTIINEEISEEIDYYLSIIDDDISYEDLEELLPPKDYGNFKEIILGIKLQLFREIKEINEVIIQDQDLSKSDLEDFLIEIKKYQKKIEMISKYENDNTRKQEESKKYNNLFFIENESGNIKLFDELNHINMEQYQDFYSLFQSIKDGTFKNIKKFNNNGNISGYLEVKENQARVVFDRVNTHDYVIITAFIKKVNVDKSYLSKLKLRIKNYKENKESIVSQLNNMEFREKNKEYENLVFEILSNEDKQDNKKVLVKE